MRNRAPERVRRLVVPLALLLSALPLLAGAEPPARFEELPPGLARTLAPFRADWAELPPERREALLRAAEVWRELDAEQRRIAARRLRLWESLTPEERVRLRAHLRGNANGRPAPIAEVLAALAPPERQQLLARLRALSPHERRLLRAFLIEKPPEARLDWVRRFIAGDERALGEALDRSSAAGAPHRVPPHPKEPWP